MRPRKKGKCSEIRKNGIGWEFKCDGQLTVCAKHRFKTCGEIEEAMKLSKK